MQPPLTRSCTPIYSTVLKLLKRETCLHAHVNILSTFFLCINISRMLKNDDFYYRITKHFNGLGGKNIKNIISNHFLIYYFDSV